MPSNDDIDEVRESRFGDTAISGFYARMKSISFENEVLRLYDIEIDDAEVRLVICNSWLVVRDISTNAVSVFERDYANRLWYRVDSANILMAIPVWPIRNLPRAATAPFVAALLRKIQIAAGEEEVAADLESRHGRRWEQCRNNHYDAYDIWRASERSSFPPELEIADPSPGTVSRAKAWFARRLFGEFKPEKHVSKRNKASKGYVPRSSVYNAIKGIRAAFHRHFRETELFRAILSMDHRNMTLADYVYYADGREGVLKTWGERRNLVPMLPYIDRRYWKEDNLFSSDWWTTEDSPVGRSMFTATDVPCLPSRIAHTGTFSLFDSCRAFKWLARSKNSVVKAWVRNGKNPVIARMMSDLNLPKDTPAPVIAHMIAEMANCLSQMHTFGIEVDGNVLFDNAFRAYVSHFARLREEIGYRAMLREMVWGERRGTSEVFDYLIQEGFADGLPARNATWTSLMRRSQEWHEPRGFLIFPSGVRVLDDDVVWETLVGPLEVEGCMVRPVTRVGDLLEEGADMKHCVGSYAEVCAAGSYRVFHISDRDGGTATLGIFVGDGGASLDQVKSLSNSAPSHHAMKVARLVVGMYDEAVKAVGLNDRKEAA